MEKSDLMNLADMFSRIFGISHPSDKIHNCIVNFTIECKEFLINSLVKSNLVSTIH